MTRIFILIVIFTIEPAMVTGQTIMLNSNQSLPLMADAGKDVTLTSGTSVVLGSDTRFFARGNYFVMLIHNHDILIARSIIIN